MTQNQNETQVELERVAVQSLTKALGAMDRSSQNGLPGHAAAVAAAAYALAVLRGQVVGAPALTTIEGDALRVSGIGVVRR